MSLVRWIPWVLFAGLPLVMLPDLPDLYGPVRWLAIAMMTFLAWAVLYPRWSEVVRATGKWPLMAMLTFLGMGFLSMTVALHPLEAFWDAIRWTMLIGLMMALVWAFRARQTLFLETLRAASVGTIIIGGIRVSQMAGIMGGFPAGGDPAASTLANPNFLAGAMAILTVLNVGLVLMDKGIVWRLIGAVNASLAAVLTVVGGSTGALLAMGVALAVLAEGLLAMGPLRGLHERLRWFRPGMLGLGLLGGLVVLVYMYGKVASVDLTLITLDSNVERLALWNKTGKMIVGSPFLGVGAGHWHYHILRMGLVSNFQGFATRYYMEAHNDFLHLAAERGILGGLAFLGLLGMAWLRGWRAATGGWANLPALVACVGLTAWMTFALTNLPAERPELVIYMLVCVAALSGRKADAPVEEKAGIAPRKALAGLITALSLCSMLIYGFWLQSDRDIYHLMEVRARQDWPKLERVAHKTASWYNPHDRISGTPIVWYEGMSLLNQGRAQDAIPLLLEAKEQHPWHPQVLSNLGAAYGMLGYYSEAEKSMEATLELFPHFEDVRMNLTEVRMASGQFIQAREGIDYWRLHPGNPRFDDYYRKITGLLDSLGVR